MAGLVPAISILGALCSPKRDHRVSPLRVGPVMTVECDRRQQLSTQRPRGY